MARRRIRARVATTHPLPAYGGIRLAESAIRQLADQLATGSVRTTFQHDSVRPVNCINVTAGIEKTEDGEFAAWIECDVDEDQWQLYDKECQAAGTPGGWSFSTVEPFASRGQQPYDMEIAADASYFSDDLLLTAAGESFPGELTITLGRLYQFSWIPDPKILVGIAQAALTSIPANLLSSYLYDLARKFKAKLSHNHLHLRSRCTYSGSRDRKLRLLKSPLRTTMAFDRRWKAYPRFCTKKAKPHTGMALIINGKKLRQESTRVTIRRHRLWRLEFSCQHGLRYSSLICIS